MGDGLELRTKDTIVLRGTKDMQNHYLTIAYAMANAHIIVIEGEMQNPN